MKKLLLSIVTLLGMTCAANAEVVIDSFTDYANVTSYQNWAPDAVKEMIEIKDGALVLTNPEATDFWSIQYMVSGGFAVTPGVEYTLTAKIKSDAAGDITAVLGTWGTTESNVIKVTGDNTYHEYSVKIAAPDITGDSFVLFQSGTLVGTIHIAYVEVSHADAIELPTTGDVLASFYTGNGAVLGGWGGGSTRETVEEDGKTCLKFTNPEKKNSWEVQLAFDYDFTPGIKYYIGFDIKGDAAKAISSGFQSKNDWKSCGSMSKFNITDNWEHVIIYGEPYDAGDGDESNPPVRWLADLGQYVGTFYLTNMTLYTESNGGAGVDRVLIPVTTRTVVYNLMGVKVLDTDNVAEISTLAKGLYIVNGKKTAIR